MGNNGLLLQNTFRQAQANIETNESLRFAGLGTNCPSHAKNEVFRPVAVHGSKLLRIWLPISLS